MNIGEEITKSISSLKFKYKICGVVIDKPTVDTGFPQIACNSNLQINKIRLCLHDVLKNIYTSFLEKMQIDVPISKIIEIIHRETSWGNVIFNDFFTESGNIVEIKDIESISKFLTTLNECKSNPFFDFVTSMQWESITFLKVHVNYLNEIVESLNRGEEAILQFKCIDKMLRYAHSEFANNHICSDYRNAIHGTIEAFNLYFSELNSMRTALGFCNPTTAHEYITTFPKFYFFDNADYQVLYNNEYSEYYKLIYSPDDSSQLVQDSLSWWRLNGVKFPLMSLLFRNIYNFKTTAVTKLQGFVCSDKHLNFHDFRIVNCNKIWST